MTLGEHALELRGSGRKAVVAFLTAGYPDDATFADAVAAAVAAGCDVVEIGVPFSDPIADGPVIQAASGTALARGVTLAGALEAARALSGRVEVPLVVMSYINPILSFGVEKFAHTAHAAGVRGVILPDVSFEESPPFRAPLGAAGIDYVDLLAPTSSDERIAAIGRDATGFVYLVSVTGVTGSRGPQTDTLPAFVERVRARTDAPLYVGFGVSTPEDAAAVTSCADGVIIGSQLIRIIDAAGADRAAERVGGFIASVRAAVDGGR